MYHVINLRVRHVVIIDCGNLKRTRFVRSLVVQHSCQISLKSVSRLKSSKGPEVGVVHIH